MVRMVDVEGRRRVSEGVKRKWQDPEHRERWVTSMRAAVKRPEVLANRRAAMARPEVKAKQAAGWDRRAMERLGLTAEEVPVWRELRGKVGSAEAVEIIKRSRKKEAVG
jgi:hypothetical protein